MPAALNLGHFGVKMRSSRDGGKTWSEQAVPTYPEQPPGAPGPAWKLEQIWTLETGGADDEPPGELNVVAEVPAAPSNLPFPERFRARYRNQYLLAANVDTVGGEALSRIPDLRELMGRGMDPGEARAEHHRLYDEEVRKVSAERAALQNAVQQDVLTDFDELPEGVDALQYLDAGGDKPRAIYGLSHNEAVALAG